MLNALAALFVFQLIGEVLVQALELPLPGPLVGMLALFASLVLRGQANEPLREASGELLRHMMLLFIPAVTGVMMHFGRVGQEWLPFLVAGLLGAALTLAVTALTLRWMLRKGGAGR